MKFEELDIIDRISDWHMLIRKKLEDKWLETSDIVISNSEWYIMNVIYKKIPTISSVTKEVKISRQAIHKFIKKLESKGLVEIVEGSNNRNRCIQLTTLGEMCVGKYIEIKKELERDIIDQIGDVHYESLKGILNFNIEF